MLQGISMSGTGRPRLGTVVLQPISRAEVIAASCRPIPPRCVSFLLSWKQPALVYSINGFIILFQVLPCRPGAYEQVCTTVFYPYPGLHTQMSISQAGKPTAEMSSTVASSLYTCWGRPEFTPAMQVTSVIYWPFALVIIQVPPSCHWLASFLWGQCHLLVTPPLTSPPTRFVLSVPGQQNPFLTGVSVCHCRSPSNHSTPVGCQARFKLEQLQVKACCHLWPAQLCLVTRGFGVQGPIQEAGLYPFSGVGATGVKHSKSMEPKEACLLGPQDLAALCTRQHFPPSPGMWKAGEGSHALPLPPNFLARKAPPECGERLCSESAWPPAPEPRLGLLEPLDLTPCGLGSYPLWSG